MKNRLLIFTLTALISTSQVSCMDTITQKETSPCETFEGTIQINQHELARYLASNYHQFFQNATGLKSYKNDPFVEVVVELQIPREQFGGNGSIKVNWTNNALATLKYYENNQKLQSPFPAFIPAAYLYNKKVGDIINFLAYGYPVKLICIDNFEKNFNDKIKGIKENANYTTIFNEFPCPKNGTQNYLITHGILNAINYKKHGPNGYNFNPNNVAQDILRHKKYNQSKNIAYKLLSRELTGSFKK